MSAANDHAHDAHDDHAHDDAPAAQGKLFGEPCSAAELLALLTRQAAGTAPFGHLLRHIEDASSRSA